MNLQDIYTEHVEFVARTLRRLGVPHHDLMDAIQEVFLKVHQALPRFEGRSALTTWLFTICRSTAKDRRQRAYVRREIQMDELLEQEKDVRDAADRLDQKRKVVLLETVLGEMDEDQRTVFMLFEIEELTGEQIAQAVGVPLGTVYSRLRLGRATFRQLLDRHLARDRRRHSWVGGEP